MWTESILRYFQKNLQPSHLNDTVRVPSNWLFPEEDEYFLLFLLAIHF